MVIPQIRELLKGLQAFIGGLVSFGNISSYQYTRNHDDAELSLAARHLPGVRIFDLLSHGNWKRLVLDLLLTEVALLGTSLVPSAFGQSQG